MARDKYHQAVKIALEKEGWKVTDDPLKLEFEEVRIQIDLGAERFIAAERKNEKIAVEIKLEQLRTVVKETLLAYSNPSQSTDERLIFDSDHDVYQWLKLGWKEMQRIFTVYVHIEIRHNQIWVERNNVEPNVVELLLARGVPKEQIGLGFQAP